MKKSKDIDLRFATVICDRDYGEKLIHSLEKLDVNIVHTVYGNGTAQSELLAVLGVAPEKILIFFTARGEIIPSVYEMLRREYRFGEKGRGIAFTLPVASVSGLAALRFIAGPEKKKAIDKE